MSWGRRRARRVATLGALGVVAVLAGPPVARAVVYRRDESGFRTYVQTYAGDYKSSDNPGLGARDQRWVTAHLDLVQAEGDRSCNWLSGQPTAPSVDATGGSTFDTILRRYRDEPASNELDGLSVWGRSTVVAGAWTYLCRGTRESRTAPRSVEKD